MKRKGLHISIGILALLMVLFSLLPVPAAHAGFVSEEDPMSAHISTAAQSQIVALDDMSQAAFPLPVSGGYVVYPGRAWKLRFMLPKDTCFRFEDHTYADYKGNPCIP